MLLVDSLIVIGTAAFSLGTIHEEQGIQEHTFWLKNMGQEAVQLRQGYTSCGCTTIDYSQQAIIQPGDSTAVTLRFNPRGKGGEFYENGTVTYGKDLKRVNMALTGECITSEETLLKQYPIRISDKLRLSTDRYDIGIVRTGQTKERHVAVLHWNETTPSGPRKTESIKITFSPTDQTPKGRQRISCPITIQSKGEQVETTIMLDVIVR